jgi:hypothetical protein
MPKKSKKNKKKKTNGRRRQPLPSPSCNKEAQQALRVLSNFVSEAGVGCYIASKRTPCDWGMLGWEDDIDPDDFIHQDVPDIALDPNDRTLTLCNITSATRVAYITVYGGAEVVLLNKHNQILQNATTTDNQGLTRKCTTFIVQCPPFTFAHLCKTENEVYDMEIDSDVQDWNEHPCPDDEHTSMLLGFPLLCGTGDDDHERLLEQVENDGDESGTADPELTETSPGLPSSYLCTQSEGGCLTHFFAGNLHAIDFRCDIGTPLLAVADGTVVSVQDDNTLTGVAVSNLFSWNSILLELTMKDEEGPLFVEYVHIQKSKVRPGDEVSKGQVIGTTGSVGFSPEPHLHFCAYRSSEATAPTVRVYFESNKVGKILPEAGKWYNAEGEVKAD